MKNKINKKIISTISLLLTVVVLYISGGVMFLVSILGVTGIYLLPGFINKNKRNLQKSNYTISIINDKNTCNTLNEQKNTIIVPSLCNNNEELNNYNKEIINEENKSEYIDLMQEIQTTPQLTQQENIKRLVRKRKKETINKF